MHPHFSETLQPQLSLGRLRGWLLSRTLPGHTRGSFHDKLAGPCFSPSLGFIHLASPDPHLPNSHNLPDV